MRSLRRKKIITWTTIALLLASIWFSKRIRLDFLAHGHDPYRASLQAIPRYGKSFVTKSGGIEYGLIQLKDGETVKFWSIVGHSHPGLPLTRFDFADGRRVYLKGGICCEVFVPNDDRATLLKFIEENQGTTG